MLIHVLSDLHIDHQPFPCPRVGADVTVLAGDIDTGMGAIDFAESLDGPVIFVPGNHEYYWNSIDKLNEKMRDHALMNDSIVIDGVRFLGATLWTDWLLYGARKQQQSMEVGRMLSDYRFIYGLTPEDTLAFFQQSHAWLDTELDKPFDGKTVVVTHHAPSPRSGDPKYEGDSLTPAFVSDVEGLVVKADLWIHGHTHYCVDYKIGKCRVVSNQRGYPRERTAFDPLMVVEI